MNKSQINNNNESIKKFRTTCSNFIRMLDGEKSESIKLNYFPGITKMSQNLGISPENTVEIIFNN